MAIAPTPSTAPAAFYPTTAGTTPTASATGATPASPAAASTPAATAAMNPVTSAALSAQAGIVATLGATGSTVQTYSPAGLLTRIEQAASDAAALPKSPLAAAGAGAGADAAASSTSDAASVMDANSNWARVLKSNPALAGVAIGNAFDQGIVNTFSTYA